MGKTWRIPNICLDIEDSRVFICKWNSVSSAECSLVFKKQLTSWEFSPANVPTTGQWCHLWLLTDTPSCFSFSSTFERNGAGGGGGMWKKWPWARDFLGPLSQINLNGDRWTQTLSLWNPNVFLGLIFVSLNPWKKPKTPLVSANKFSFLHYKA